MVVLEAGGNGDINADTYISTHSAIAVRHSRWYCGFLPKFKWLAPGCGRRTDSRTREEEAIAMVIAIVFRHKSNIVIIADRSRHH